MALKDWKRQNVGTIGNTNNVVWWQKKGTNSDDRLELYSVKEMEFTPVRKEFTVWVVEQRALGQKKFKTRSQAMCFANNYMKTH